MVTDKYGDVDVEGAVSLFLGIVFGGIIFFSIQISTQGT